MSKITVFEHVTLDGVMQAPARPDEDTRGGFTQGGWANRYADAVAAEVAGKHMAAASGSALLFGRRTYEDFYRVWPSRPEPNPFTDVLNRTQKYVTSRTLHEPLAWANATLLSGDAAESVAQLKDESGQDLVVLGSGGLVHSLLAAGLVDELALSIYPLVLGSGLKLFDGASRYAEFHLDDAIPTTTGVIIATYTRVD